VANLLSRKLNEIGRRSTSTTEGRSAARIFAAAADSTAFAFTNAFWSIFLFR
jgi:hypothetical protein